MKNVLFVCTGNTCRSPMAEALLRNKAGDRFAARSAGVFSPNGRKAAAEALQVLQDKGIDLEHETKQLDALMVAWADVILTMTEGHKRTVLQQFPESVGKVYTLKEYVDDDPGVEEIWKRLEALYAELETKRALSDEGNVRELEDEIRALENQLPAKDISDPFGRELDTYRRVCEEIEGLLDRLICKECNED